MFFVDLYTYFMLSRKTQHVAKQYIENRLDYYLITILWSNMNYGFYFFNHLN